MFICQTVNSERFLETLFCTRSFTSLLRFGSLNTLLTLPVEKDCVGKAKQWHYSTEWNLRFIQNVASCYVLCLTKESVNTATLIHAPVCVCVCVRATHTARRSECAWNIKWRRVRIEFPPSPDSDRSLDFEKPCSSLSFKSLGLAIYVFKMNLFSSPKLHLFD